LREEENPPLKVRDGRPFGVGRRLKRFLREKREGLRRDIAPASPLKKKCDLFGMLRRRGRIDLPSSRDGGDRHPGRGNRVGEKDHLLTIGGGSVSKK